MEFPQLCFTLCVFEKNTLQQEEYFHIYLQ